MPVHEPPHIHDVSEAEFNRSMQTLGAPALLYIWAPWCAPCQVFSPVFEATVSTLPSLATFRINAASAPQIQTTLNLATVPAVIAFDQDGSETGRFIGLRSRQQLHDWIVARMAIASPDVQTAN
ncbi:MAG: thioredoxin family protein [Paucimonas sp.]|jgi:thioredoxin-like negative regulator of GroEL|nr:thioredoxin family protein [Paucimonas sp.]